MEKDLIKFYNNITFINKELAKYEDEKGNIQYLPIGQLVCNLTYNELDDKQLEVALFSKTVDNIEYEKTKVIRPINKYEITKNKKDKNTLVDQEVEVSKVWVIQNAFGIFKSYNNLDEAKSMFNEINDKILKQAQLI